MGSIWDNAMTGFMAAAFIPPPMYAAHPEKRIRPPVKVLARRRFMQLAAGAAALPAIPRIAAAQSYPSRPITMIVPAPAGGRCDRANYGRTDAKLARTTRHYRKRQRSGREHRDRPRYALAARRLYD
jgi:hypothetical protein